MVTCDSICVGEWIFLFLWFISVPIYCMVIYVIWKHRRTKFKEEFWILSIALFVADMFHLGQVMWSQKLSAWGILPSVLKQTPNLVGWLMLAPKVAFSIAQIMGLVFLSLNRYMAIVKSSTYSVVWSRKVTILCICAQWSTAILVLLILAQIRFTLQHNSDDDGFAGIPADQGNAKMAAIFIGVMFGFGGLLRVLLFIFLYASMFYYVYKENQASQAIQGPNRRQRTNRGKFNLAIIGAILALCDIAITANAIGFAIYMKGVDKVETEELRLWQFRGTCFTDIYGWMNGWIMLICGSAVRKQFLKQYRCVK